MPYSFVEEVRFDEELYQVHVAADDGRDHVFGMMGKRSTEFVKELRRTLDALAARTARTLVRARSGAGARGAVGARRRRMRDGRAVQQREVDAVAPGAWPRLVDAVMGTPDLRSTYERLTSMCPPGWSALGVKAVLTEGEQDAGTGSGSGEGWQPPEAATSRTGHLEHTQDSAAANRAESSGRQAGMPPGIGGLMAQMGEQMSGAASAAAEEAARAAVAEAMAQMAGQQQQQGAAAPDVAEGPGGEGAAEPDDGRAETVQWFFTPLADGGRPLNAVAQEITSEKGHATYVFRLMPPEAWEAARSAGDDALAGAVTAAVARVNRALLTLNFRREPIYLPDDQITTGSYARYRAALRKLDYLQWTRQAFLGRAIHNTTWEQQLVDLAAQA